MDDIVDHYGASYGSFSSDLLEEIRRQSYGQDIGQNSWLTAEEQDGFIDSLELDADSHLLDIACGSGGPTLRIAERMGCAVSGIDLHEVAIYEARAAAESRGLGDRASFELGDASPPLPFGDATFDALICIDAINHLPDRPAVLNEWARVLRPHGRLVFTDPIVVTGPLTDEEMRIRSSIGFFLFVPSDYNEHLLPDCGFEDLEIEDRTDNMARIAAARFAAREQHEAELRALDGDSNYEGQQTFFQVAAQLAGERRLSRFAYHARRA